MKSFSQTPTSVDLDTLVIHTYPIPKKIKEASNVINFIKREALENGNSLNYSKVINRTSGVFMQSGTLNTNRITIRGIGARSPFSTTGIKAYLGEIPLTNGDGVSAIENIELESLESIAIHKGPVNSGYGVSLGGLILLMPKKANSSSISYKAGIGSFGLQRNVVEVGLVNTSFSGQVVYSNSFQEGYRENNRFSRNTVTFFGSQKIDAKNTLDIVANYFDLKAFIPSSLSETDFRENPKKAAFTWGQAKGFEDVKSILFGMTWNHLYNNELEQKTSVFGRIQENDEPRPFNILKEDSKNYGIRYRLLYTKSKVKFSLGGTLFLEQADEKLFENLYQDFPSGTGSVQGDLFSSFQYKRSFYNLFAETNVTLSKKLGLSLGVNLNQTFFRVSDNFNLGVEDKSGNFDFKPILSPKIEIHFKESKMHTFFASISHGFTTPTSEETLLPDGVFNPDLKPEIGWSYEVGSTSFLANNRLQIGTSFFFLDVKDLLVNRRTQDDQLFAVNAGETNHFGVELAVDYKVLDLQKMKLIFHTNATFNRFRFLDFEENGNNFSGNKLTGVPSEVFNFETRLQFLKHWNWTVNFQHVGQMPVNDANDFFTDKYQILDSQLYYQKAFKKISVKAVIGLQNSTNTSYASQIQVNARGFGGNAPRFFYPGNPRNYYSSLQVKYLF